MVETPTTEFRKKIYVWTDFVCPYCLLGEGRIKEAIKGLDVELVWMPFELRAHPTPTLRPEGDYLIQSWESGVYPTAEKEGVPIKLPTISPQPYTRTAFIGMQYAADKGRRNEYVEAVIRAFFQQDRDVGDVTVLKDIAGKIGLDEVDFEQALTAPKYAKRHDQALIQARQIGIQAVPTILVGDQMMSGMTDPSRLRTAVLAAKENLLG